MNRYDIAAYVWPAYCPDQRAKIFWPTGMGEWETVLKNAPRFKGHAQPRYPLWGCVNEADPYVMEMEIEAATDHGVNVFIYDWYWYDGMPFLEGCLNEGFLKAKNNHKMKFYLMWANHDVPLFWDKRNSDDAFSRRNTSLVWKGGIDRTEFEKIGKRFIEKYFSHPCYYKIDGKPVFMLYDLNTFIKGMGGVDEAKAALDWFRGQVSKAGHPGLELQLCLRNDRESSLSGIEEDRVGTQAELIEAVAFDSLTHYQFAHCADVDRDYSAVVEDAVKEWAAAEVYSATYYPHLSVGWDSSPRTTDFKGSITTKNTPEEFEKALGKAKAFIDAHPEQAPLITINSWNEWTETSYLEPCTMHGYGYLDSVKRVFKDHE